MNLTKNFTLKELTYSATAVAKRIDNTPDKKAYENLKKLAAVLQLIRDEAGQAITVSSGYRSPELNAAVGGVPASLHVQGLAADIPIKWFELVAKMQLEGLFRSAFGFGIELIREKTVCHIGINLDGRDEYIANGGQWQKQ
jgi:uncharacterized protein YcbK (DUF882 family)